MYQVLKRDGKVADFSLDKISEAIKLAFEAQEKQYHPTIIDFLALKVTADFEPKIKEGLIAVEDIQDSVESTLVQAGYADVAKAYILYRKQREKMRNMKSTILDYKDIVDSYVKVTDWRVKENSTVTYSVGGLILSNSGAITANYWLSEVYDEEIANAHRNADIHIHDLSMLTGYCAGWSLKQLIQEGLGGVPGKITSAPAAHLSTLCNQMVNFLGIMQNEWAGAQAFSSFDTYLAPFVKVDNLDYKQVKKCIESFIFGVNTLTTGTIISPATIATAPALIGDAMNLINIFATVIPTPHTKLAQTAAFVTPFQYRPYINGARNAPASAPQEIPINCAIKVGGSNAIKTLITTKNTSIILMHRSCIFSSIFLTTFPLIRSSVKVELDVSTSDDKVDIDADNTNTITIPIKISGKVDNIDGIIAS